jgi:methyltransferase (TIGR00027 family)
MRGLERRLISPTAQAAALGRAIESLRRGSDRLVDDPFARAFHGRRQEVLLALMRLPSVASMLLWLQERRLPGVLGNLLCRTRYIDEALRNGLEIGAQQVVILGAGLDSRAYRLAALQGIPVFEIDRPELFGVKRPVLEAILGSVPANVKFVSADLDRVSLDHAMGRAGFDPSARSFFVGEGVTQYLTGDGIENVLAFVAGCALGSRIAFTYINRAIIEGRCTRRVDRKLKAWMERIGEPWRSGIDPDQIDCFLAARGLKLIAHGCAAEYRARYLEPTGRRLNLYDEEYVAVAEVI